MQTSCTKLGKSLGLCSLWILIRSRPKFDRTQAGSCLPRVHWRYAVYPEDWVRLATSSPRFSTLNHGIRAIP